MVNAKDFLAHYASEYYDPVKAKAYYERTKKLKGRKSAGPKLTAAQRQRQAEGLAYVKNKIATKKKGDLEKATKDATASLEALQKTADETRARIVGKLQELMTKLEADLNGSMNKIPANASPKLREFLERQNKVRAGQAKQKLSAASKEAREQMRTVGTELRDAVSKARESYNQSKKDIQEKYEKALKTETENIQKKVR